VCRRWTITAASQLANHHVNIGEANVFGLSNMLIVLEKVAAQCIQHPIAAIRRGPRAI
jgi:hypothetical protein